MIIIRSTTLEDWETLKALRLAALQDAPKAFGVSYASAAALSDAQWRERAAGAGPAQFLLALIDDVALGMAGDVVSPAAQFNLIAMWVKPQWRGGAAASSLVDAVKARALERGHARVVLSVSPDNTRAAAFYRKQGFTFLQEWEALASDPDTMLQKMEWRKTS